MSNEVLKIEDEYCNSRKNSKLNEKTQQHEQKTQGFGKYIETQRSIIAVMDINLKQVCPLDSK